MKIHCKDHKSMFWLNRKFWNTSTWATNKVPNWRLVVKNGAMKVISWNQPFSQMLRTIWPSLKMRYATVVSSKYIKTVHFGICWWFLSSFHVAIAYQWTVCKLCIVFYLMFWFTQFTIFHRPQIFGPVQTILKFKTLEEAIERSNKTSYGLAAGIMTKNLEWALTYCKAADAGSVWVNCYDVATPQTPVIFDWVYSMKILDLSNWIFLLLFIFLPISSVDTSSLAMDVNSAKMVLNHIWKPKQF